MTISGNDFTLLTNSPRFTKEGPTSLRRCDPERFELCLCLRGIFRRRLRLPGVCREASQKIWPTGRPANTLAKALQLDDSIGEAHDTLGALSSFFDWDWETADREFNRAIAWC